MLLNYVILLLIVTENISLLLFYYLIIMKGTKNAQSNEASLSRCSESTCQHIQLNVPFGVSSFNHV